MDDRAQGIVLRVRPLTDSSLVVHWLTPDAGRIATVAKGARRPKSPFLGKLDVFLTADISFARSTRSDLHTLREVSVVQRRNHLAHDLHSLRIAAYAVNAVESVTESDTPIPEIHDLFVAFIEHIARQPAAARSVFAFELRLLSLIGLEPDPAETALPTAGRDLFVQLLETDWPDLPALIPAPGAARALHQFLHGFLIHHLGRLPKGRTEAING